MKQGLRFYIPHHFIFYPVMGLLIAFCFYNRHSGRQEDLWLFMALSFLAVTVLSFMLRQHYALGNQDRIVRLEVKYRYFATTGKRFEPYEAQLSFKQIAALRFASDPELETLVQKTVSEKLNPAEIKKAIRNWVPDNMRL